MFLFLNHERLKLDDVPASLFAHHEVDAMRQAASAATHVIIFHARLDPVAVEILLVAHLLTFPPRRGGVVSCNQLCVLPDPATAHCIRLPKAGHT